MAYDTTCWFLVRDAASGQETARNEFASYYGPVVRAYLGRRWRSTGYLQYLDDAVQELFVEFFRDGGVLAKVDGERPGGFRALLYGVSRNIALRFETRYARRRHQTESRVELDGVERDEATLSRVFDRLWLRSLLRQAAAHQEARAQTFGPDAERRVELLQMLFRKEMSFREIADLWQVEVKSLYREAARAREEFKDALYEVVSFHNPGDPGEIERECKQLLALVG